MSKKTGASAAQKRRTQARGRDNRVWFVIVCVGAVVVVGAVIAAALASTQPALAEPAAEPVIVSGQPLPAYPDSGTDPALGMLLPTLRGTGLVGEPVTIGPDGRAKAIVVLAHWCPHCQAEVPRLVAWLADNPLPEGVDVIGLSTAIDEARPNFPPSAWLEREGWVLSTLNDDAGSSAYLALGALNTPGWVFVGADGTVRLRTTGELDPAEFGAILEQLAP
ncbi:MAG TPA: TlpA disulfide reductase family protein [Candidatus Limnocylindria bacterium]